MQFKKNISSWLFFGSLSFLGSYELYLFHKMDWDEKHCIETYTLLGQDASKKIFYGFDTNNNNIVDTIREYYFVVSDGCITPFYKTYQVNEENFSLKSFCSSK